MRRVVPADGDDTRLILEAVRVQAGATRVGLALRHRVLDKKCVWNTEAQAGCIWIIPFDR